jgi:hypothetical protein
MREAGETYRTIGAEVMRCYAFSRQTFARLTPNVLATSATASPCVDPLDGLVSLVHRELLRPTEAHPARPGAFPALARAAADQCALELGESAEDRQHELAVRRRPTCP